MGITTAVAAVASVAYSVYNGQKQQAQAKDSAHKADDNAKAAATAADEDMNRKNGKTPNFAAINTSNTNQALTGIGGTSLTGPAGVDPSSLSLGKNTLLGT